MYYKLEPKFVDNTMMIDKTSHRKYSLTLGEALPEDLPEPIKFDIDTEINSYSYLPTSFLPEPIFSVEFIQALRTIGVDNFDVHEVEIKNPDTGEIIQGYKAANIIGKISCVDMNASESDRLIEDQYVIRKLVIDPSKTYGFYLFRLAEWTQIILVHEHVVENLPPELRKDFNFEPVEEI